MSAIELGVVTARTHKHVEGADAAPEAARNVAADEEAVPPIHTEKLRSVRLNAALLHENRIIVDAHSSPAGAAYKVLRTRLLQTMRTNGWSTLGVTSTAPSEGKTVTAINLALSFARDVNTTTVLADFDLRKPSVAKYLGVLPEYGLGDVLEGRLPLLAGDDVLAFAPHVDALLLVLAEGVTTREGLAAARELVKDFNIAGTVLNRSVESLSSHYYYYSYGSS